MILCILPTFFGFYYLILSFYMHSIFMLLCCFVHNKVMMIVIIIQNIQNANCSYRLYIIIQLHLHFIESHMWHDLGFYAQDHFQMVWSHHIVSV